MADVNQDGANPVNVNNEPNAMEEEELSPELLEKVLQLQEVTGVECVDESRRLLQAHDWNVESAVHHYLSSVEVNQEPIEESTVRHRSVRSQSFQDASSHAGQSSANPPIQPQGARGIVATLGYGLRLITWPLTLAFASFSSLISYVCRLVWPRHHRLWDPQADILSFLSEFDSLYGMGHPQFFRGSYSQALSHAKSELKFLLVYLHSPHHQDTQHFCKTTLQQQELVSYLDSTMVVWGCSVTSPEGYRVSQALRENSYPFLAVIVVRGGRMTVVARLEGPTEDATILLEKLRKVVSENEAHLVLARADRHEREQTAALRQEQDQAYMESLLADQEKAKQRLAEQQLRESLENQELEKEREEQRKLDLMVQKKEDSLLRVPQEPPVGIKDNVIHILVKLPCGERLERRFYSSESMKGLYYFIFCQPNAPHRFEVLTNYPRKTVPCEPATDGEADPPTFREFALPPRTMLLVTDLDA